MTALEKLARRICWVHFARRPQVVTEAEYWRHVAPDAKDRYLEDARLLVFMSRKLEENRSSHELLWAARREMKS